MEAYGTQHSPRLNKYVLNYDTYHDYWSFWPNDTMDCQTKTKPDIYPDFPSGILLG